MLFFSHNLAYEGAPLSLVQVLQGVVAGGAQVALVSDVDGPLRAEAARIGADVRIFPYAGTRRVHRFYHWARQLLFARRFGPDLIYANTVHMFPAVWMARLLRVPAIWCIRESISPFSASLPRRREVLRTFGLRPEVVFVADATRRLWQPVLGQARAHVIPNGIATEAIDQFRAQAVGSELRRRVGLPDKARAVVIVGTTCERKGQQIFVEAALKLLRQYPGDVHFFIVGAREGAYLDRLRGTILQGGGIDRIHLIHETAAGVLSYYAIADVFCCCSFEESHPRVVLEAMAFGVPIVATRVWGIPEQVEEGVSALLVPAGDPLALAARIGELLADPVQAAGVGRAARQRFEERFRAEVMNGHYQDLFTSLLDGEERHGAGG
ncbi:MAG: glycosyltransferase family 4 protein [Candidatus Rokuibacteriota bacterium]